MLYLIVQIGETSYALPSKGVVGVLPYVEVRPVARCPRGLAGVVNYHGQPVPVVDLCLAVLDRPARQLFTTRLVLFEVDRVGGGGSRGGGAQGGPSMLGLIAEGVTRTIRAEPKDFADTGIRSSEAWLGGVRVRDGEVLQLLDIGKLLSRELRQALALCLDEPESGIPA